jgi:hypothetical protein
MTGIETHRVALPEDWRRLEPVSNSLSPIELEDGPFRRALAALRRELRLEAVPTRQDRREHGLRTMDDDEEAPGRPRGRRRARRERGQVTIEAIVGLAVALGIFLVLMQTALMAMGTVASKRAADAAALVGSRGGSQAEAEEAARGKTPPFFDVEVSPVAGGSSEYRATLLVPSVVPFINRPLTSTAAAAEEE